MPKYRLCWNWPEEAASGCLLSFCPSNQQDSAYEAKKNEPFSLVFENPYAEPRELYWIGAEPSLMGTVEPGGEFNVNTYEGCLLYTSPSPRDRG